MSDLLGRGLTRLLRVLVLSLLLACSGVSQEPASPPTQTPPPSSEQNSRKKPSNNESGDQNQAKSQAQSPPETKITPEQAEQLFHDVDTILVFASKDTLLPIKHEVKRRLVGRDEVVSYLKKNMAEDKDVRRLRRTELVLKKFGLLPSDFDLQTFLVSLLEEQVAGYYDAKTKTVNLLDWVVPDLQRPVLAHELTHALQDQSFSLDKWLKKGEEDLDTKKDLTPDDITRDENAEAREAVVEGQAMAVFVDYMLAPVHQSVADAPEFVRELSAGTADSPQFRKAPILIKQSLMFPYTYGIQFEAELLRTQGKDKAYAATFQNPPQTSREIMEPSTYISGEHLAPLPLPDFKHILKGYDRFDVGAVGEFDVAVLAEQYSSPEASRRIYSSWRGGYYYSARPKGTSSASLGLVFVSKWASAKAAAQFAAVYAQGMKQRYKSVDARADSTLPADLKTLQSLSGDHAWKTEEGDVVIAVKENMVLVTESLTAGITDQLRHAVLPATPQ